MSETPQELAQSIRGKIAKWLGIDSWNFRSVFENMERDVLVPLLRRVIEAERDALRAEVAQAEGVARGYMLAAEKAEAEVERLRDIISPGDAAAYEEGMAALQARLRGLEAALLDAQH